LFWLARLWLGPVMHHRSLQGNSHSSFMKSFMPLKFISYLQFRWRWEKKWVSWHVQGVSSHKSPLTQFSNF
jgi:hypothetical protein